MNGGMKGRQRERAKISGGWRVQGGLYTGC